MKRVLATAAFPAFVAITAWLGGYNFDSRSGWLAYGFFWSVAGSLWIWFGPWWDSE